MLVPAIPKAAATVTAFVAAQTILQRWVALPTFRAHRLLCELRPVGGNSTVAQQNFAQLRPTTTAADESDYPVCLWKSTGWTDQESKAGTRTLMRNKLMVKTNGKGNNVHFAVYGRTTLGDDDDDDDDTSPSQRIERFIRTNTKHHVKPRTLTDARTFVRWMSAMDAVRQEKNRSNNTLQPGKYRFCFRDYWNYEEEWLFQCQRWGIFQRLLVQPKARTLFEVKFNDTTKMTTIRLVERSRLLCGLIPLRMLWTGTLRNAAILDWDYSEMRLGFKWLCKVIPRPAPSEKLRKAPWELCGGTKDWFVVERQGYGRLTFAKESTLP